jgi:putative protease
MAAKFSNQADRIDPPPAPPLILAPAGSKASFLAALAAGADAVYCGLKSFSARMEAKNFTLEELHGLVELAHSKSTHVYVTLNTLLRPGELDAAGRLLDQLGHHVRPDAVIVQDLAMARLVRQTGFQGEVHWSTLSNMSFPAALALIQEKLPIDRLVLPRELTVDEIKAIAAACPPGLELEVFIHGALCYGVSGRCYWSSFLGGKSGLRGRCVQPCRRMYTQAGETHRFFSCLDLSLDVLVKVLMNISRVRTWKIEGRKKGPHYVYYVVSGYRLLRDHASDPQSKKDALYFLSRALGRPGTHYRFLSQRPQSPVNCGVQTASGFLVGRTRCNGRQALVRPQEQLLAGDVLRIGYEDAPGHRIECVGRSVPKGGRYILSPNVGTVPKNTPVFLIDRREEDLTDLITRLEAELPATPTVNFPPSPFKAELPSPGRAVFKPIELRVYRQAPRPPLPHRFGLWLSPEALETVPARAFRSVWWWLPPVLYPDDQAVIRALIESSRTRGSRTFVLNDPWQVSLFRPEGPETTLWAGPFCNLANPLALETVATLGFSGAIVSPELAATDFQMLAGGSPLALGAVVGGNWPLCVARSCADDLQLATPLRSPKGEEAWAARYGALYWIFPNWKLDLRGKAELLRQAGYCLLVHLVEPLPSAVRLKERPGLWNWKGELL